MSDSSIPVRSRRRRRLALWLGFGAIGVTMGVVWATGFATFTAGANGSSAGSPVVTPASPTSSNPLTGTVSANAAAWHVDWTGDWGSTAGYSFFQVDLTGQPSGRTYNLAMLLTNGSAMAGAADKWQTLQLKTELRQAAGASCQASDFNAPGGEARVFSFESQDAAVYWNDGDADIQSAGGIVSAGGNPYCVGVEAASPPYDGSGTFLRDTGTPPTVYPNFVLTVNRAS
jgi:hypothetical protein